MYKTGMIPDYAVAEFAEDARRKIFRGENLLEETIMGIGRHPLALQPPGVGHHGSSAK
ncbi:MAG: hypothetical protein J7K15_13340 [Deltaproteobacteria bacterium]|nr:hypothetical protein [Deltaproteobacteria bacterium]